MSKRLSCCWVIRGFNRAIFHLHGRIARFLCRVLRRYVIFLVLPLCRRFTSLNRSLPTSALFTTRTGGFRACAISVLGRIGRRRWMNPEKIGWQGEKRQRCAPCFCCSGLETVLRPRFYVNGIESVMELVKNDGSIHAVVRRHAG